MSGRTPRPARDGVGLVLGLVLVVLSLLAVVLTAQGSLSSGIADQVERDLRAEEADALADSALEEALARIALEANGGADGSGRGKIFGLFRGAQNPAWDPQLGFRIPLESKDLPGLTKLLARRPLHRSPAPEVTARVRFQRFYDADGLREHDERFGTLELTASIAYPSGRGTARRKAVRWTEFRVVHLGLPAPFDRTPLHINDPETFVNAHALALTSVVPWANDLIDVAARGVQATPDQLSSLLAKLREVKSRTDEAANTPGPDLTGEKAKAAELSGRLARVIAAFSTALGEAQAILLEMRRDGESAISGRVSGSPLRLFGWPLVLYLFDPDRSPPEVALDDMNMPRKTLQMVARKASADQRHAATGQQFASALGALSPQLEAAGTAFAAAAVDRAKALQSVLKEYASFQRGHLEQGGDDHFPRWQGFRRVLDEDAWKPLAAAPGAGAAPGGTPGIRGSKAQFVVGPAADAGELRRELEALLDRYGPAFQGVVYVDNAAGAELVLDGARPEGERWTRFAGRLLLAVSGNCTLRDVKRLERARDLLTVVCYGELTLGGSVEASVVVRRALRRMPPPSRAVRLTGCLVMDDRPFTVSESPEATLAGITLVRDDLVPSWTPENGNRPEYAAVLFGPGPAYTSSPRQAR